MSDIIADIFGEKNILYTFIDWICSVWNGFIDAAWGLIAQTPAEISPDSWALVTGDLKTLFTNVGASLVVVFFLLGYIRNAMDLNEELTYEKVTMLLFMLGVVETVYVLGIELIPVSCTAAKGLVLKIKDVGGIDSIHLSAESLESIPWDDMGMITIIIGLLLSIFALIAAVVCGGIIVWGVLGRVFKVFVLIPIAAVPLSTLAGGNRTWRPALNWLMEFLISVFEVVLIAIVLILGAYFIGSNILNNYFQFGSDDPLKATCTGIFMMIINMGVVAGAVKGWEAILRRVFS